MRAVRSDVFRETHQSSRSRDKIAQGKVYYRDTECITTQIGPKFLSRSTFKAGTRNQHSSAGTEPLHRQEERHLPYSSTLATKKNELPVRGAGRSISQRPPDRRDTGCQQAYFATVLIGNVCPPSSKAVRERRMPSLRILCWSVDLLTPRRAAAPFGPEITPFVSSRARRI
jgi:hypothetical protein